MNLSPGTIALAFAAAAERCRRYYRIERLMKRAERDYAEAKDLALHGEATLFLLARRQLKARLEVDA